MYCIPPVLRSSSIIKIISRVLRLCYILYALILSCTHCLTHSTSLSLSPVYLIIDIFLCHSFCLLLSLSLSLHVFSLLSPLSPSLSLSLCSLHLFFHLSRSLSLPSPAHKTPPQDITYAGVYPGLHTVAGSRDD